MYAAIMMAIFVMIVAPLGAMRFHEKDDEIREFEGFEAPIKWISKLGAMVFIMVLSMEGYFEVFDLIDAFLAYARSNHPAEESVFCFVVVMAGIGFLCYKALTMVAVVGSWLKCGFITWDRSRRERKAKKAHDELMQKIADIVRQLQFESEAQRKYAEQVSKAATQEGRGQEIISRSAKERKNIIKFRAQ